MTPQLFSMHRGNDESGVSGIGHVLDGVVFHNGKVVVCWRTAQSSVAIYDSFEAFHALHIASHPTNETRLTWSEDE